jgi:regulator of nucleoside diphosphate kinase
MPALAPLCVVVPGRSVIHVAVPVFERLQALVALCRGNGRADESNLDKLEEELDRAILVDKNLLPPEVVTLDSQVRVVDRDSGEEWAFTLVLPSRADIDAGRVSVLAPLGTAVLGYRSGDEIEWEVPGGPRRLKVTEVRPPDRQPK